MKNTLDGSHNGMASTTECTRVYLATGLLHRASVCPYPHRHSDSDKCAGLENKHLAKTNRACEIRAFPSHPTSARGVAFHVVYGRALKVVPDIHSDN